MFAIISGLLALFEGGDFAPRFGDARLEAGAVQLSPVEIGAPGPEAAFFREFALRVEGGQLVALRRGDGEPRWTLPLREGLRPRYFVERDGTLYLMLYAPGGTRSGEARVRRLALSNGQWLPPLGIPDPGSGEEVAAVLAAERAVYVLSFLPGPAAEYRITNFRDGSLAWSRRFPFRRRFVPGRPVPLALAGDLLVVCAGPHEDLLALADQTGEERWRREAIWELRRAFVGPSVWTYSVKRIVAADDEPGRGRLAALSHVVAGPFAVRAEDGFRVFAAVGLDRDEYSRGYLTEGLVLEFDERGVPVSAVQTPRAVRTGLDMESGILWFLKGGALAFSEPSSGAREMIIFGGGDAVGRLAWYRDAPAGPRVQCRLATMPAGEYFAREGDTAFRVRFGGFVPDGEPGSFCLPLERVDLRTGVAETLLLSVPFGGHVPSAGEEELSRPTVIGVPHGLWIAGLAFAGGRLTVTVAGKQPLASEMTFDLQALK